MRITPTQPPITPTQPPVLPAAVPAYAPQPVQPVESPHAGLDDSTGTFTQVLLTGLGGETEPPPAPLPSAHLQPPPATAVQRLVATTRRLGARLNALRGDERTAMLAIGAVVGMVLLVIVVLVILVRLTADDAPGAAVAAPGRVPATTQAANANPNPNPSPSQSQSESPATGPEPPAGGQFAARHSGYCLAAPVDRTDDGAQLVQRTCGTDPATGFHLVAKPGRTDAFSLVDAGTGRCADVLGGSAADGVAVVQWTCHGGDNQVFELRELPGSAGFVQIVAEHSGKCLDVAGQSRDEGAPIQQFECRDAVTEAGYGNQSWKLTPG
jgi:hypothetical protein